MFTSEEMAAMETVVETQEVENTDEVCNAMSSGCPWG